MRSLHFLCLYLNIVYISLFFIHTDCFKSDDAGTRECDSESADSNSSRGSAVLATYVDQTTRSGDTID